MARDPDLLVTVRQRIATLVNPEKAKKGGAPTTPTQ